MHKGIFITGTDTGVGKTFVAAGIIKAMREMGINVCPMKPFETGCKMRGGKLYPEDSLKLIEAAGINEPLDLINPYRFRKPLAPAVASEIEGVAISKRKIFAAYKQLLKKYDFTIVEGVGGIMVPVYKKYLCIDLINDLNVPVIIVSKAGLGTINHTLLTIDAARRRGIDVQGVVINNASGDGKDLSKKSNPVIIEGLGGIPVLGIIPYLKDKASSLAQLPLKRIAREIIKI